MGWVITVEDWAEIRRLYLAERMPIKAIAKKLGLARNTVRSAVRSVQPPQYVRAGTGSIVDAVEPQIRGLLSHAHSCSSAVRQRTSLCRLDICATYRRSDGAEPVR